MPYGSGGGFYGIGGGFYGLAPDTGVDQTFSDFDQFWYDRVSDDFRFQVFGNANGARVQWRRAMYRIRSVTVTATGVEYTGESDTTFGDFDESCDMTPGMTFDDFDDSFSGLSFNDFALIPLPNVLHQYEQ